MSQKLLAYLFYGFLVLTVIAALFLLKNQLDQKDLKQQQIDSRANVVSRVDIESTKPHGEKLVIEQPDNKAITPTEQTIKTSQDDKQALSYLDIYYQLKDAKTCLPIFQRWQNNGLQDDLTSLVGKAFHYYDSPNYGENEKPPITAGQQNLLKQWHGKCLYLWQEYGNFDVNKDDKQFSFNSIPAVIEQRLNATATKTVQEIELKNVIRTSLQWQQKYQALENSLMGEDSLSEPEIVEINNQIEQLTQQRERLFQEIPQPSEEGVDVNQALLAEITSTNGEIIRLSDLLSQQKVVNEDLVKQVSEQFNAIDQQLFRFFYTQNGDVFYEALTTIVGFDNVRYVGSGYSSGGEARNQRITPVDMVLEANKLTKGKWYIDPLNSATHLYLCDLGMNCGADSRLMFDFCLKGYQVYPKSCGLSVQDFYKQHFISPNQWQDVTTFKHSYQDIFNG